MQDEELQIDDDIKAAIGSAFESGNVVTVGYVGDDGGPGSRAVARYKFSTRNKSACGLVSLTPDWHRPSVSAPS